MSDDVSSPLYKLKFLFLILTFALGTVLFSNNSAWAACSNPSGSAGDQMYNSTSNVMQFCDGTDWTAMKKAAETDPQVASVTSGKVCKGNGSAATCNLTMPSCTGGTKALQWNGSAFTCTTISTQKGCANSATTWGSCSSSATGIQLHGTALARTDVTCCDCKSGACSGYTGTKTFTCTDGSWVASGGGCSICNLADCTPSCFIAGTLVTMADGTEKAIEQLVAGDVVLGMDNAHNTVIDMEVPPIGDRVLYAFNGGNFFVTREHPFMLETGQWASINPDATKDEKPTFTKKYGDIKSLKVGDVILTKDNKNLTLEKIESRDRYTKTMPVYNPILDGNHTYYADGFLVHNKM